MSRPRTIRTELDSDPGRYSGLTDLQARDDLNTPRFDGPPDATALRQYLFRNKFRNRPLYGAVAYVAGRTIGDLIPYGSGGADITVTDQHVSSALSLLELASRDGIDVALTEAELQLVLDDLALGSGCHAIGAADKTALIGLSQNRVSRAAQLGLGSVSTFEVFKARALP